MAQRKSWDLFHEHLGAKINDDEYNDVTFTFNQDVDNDDCIKNIVKANRGLLSLLSPVFKLRNTVNVTI